MYLLRLNLRVELKSKLTVLIFETDSKKFDREQGLASTALLMAEILGPESRLQV